MQLLELTHGRWRRGDGCEAGEGGLKYKAKGGKKTQQDHRRDEKLQALVQRKVQMLN